MFALFLMLQGESDRRTHRLLRLWRLSHGPRTRCGVGSFPRNGRATATNQCRQKLSRVLLRFGKLFVRCLLLVLQGVDNEWNNYPLFSEYENISELYFFAHFQI